MNEWKINPATILSCIFLPLQFMLAALTTKLCHGETRRVTERKAGSRSAQNSAAFAFI